MFETRTFGRLLARFRARLHAPLSSKPARQADRRRKQLGHKARLLESLEDRQLLTAAPSISGLVWNDLNVNGIQDAGEPAVAAAAVELFSSVDQTISNSDDVSCGVAITDANGHYQFDNLALDTRYFLAFRAPVGFGFTAQDQGGNETTDSDADASGQTAFFTLTAGAQQQTIDAGLTGTAPGFGFARRLGGTGSDVARGVAADAAGNLYEVGSFQGTVDFDPGPGTYNLTSAGGDDIFAAKYTSRGALVWARRFGSPGSDIGYGIALGPGDSVYTTGHFSNALDFDPGVGTSILTIQGGSDAFVSKLDTQGNFIRACRLGGTGNDSAKGIAVADDGSAIVTGTFEGTADFNPGSDSYNLSSLGGSDVFVTKLDAAGGFAWAASWGSISTEVGNAIALGTDGSVYTTGIFRNTIDFDPGPGIFNLTGIAADDAYVSKLDSSGSFLWAAALQGSYWENGFGIATGPDNSVYSVGSFSGTADFDPGPGTFNLTASGDDAYVSKLDADGGFVWARRWGGSGFDQARAVAVGGDGSVSITGRFTGTADLDPGPLTDNRTSVGGEDVFLSQLDTAGQLLSVRSTGGSGNDGGYAIAAMGEGRATAVGSFEGTVDFDPGSAIAPLAAAGGTDGFLWSLMPPHAPTEVQLPTNAIAENQPIGSIVGVLSSVDLDSWDAFTYQFAAGPGDGDNRLFSIAANGDLRTAAIFDYEATNSYQIRIRSTDHAGLWTESALTIRVLDVDDALTVSGRIWNDLDADGIQGPGEPGLAGVMVQAFLDFDGIQGNADDAPREAAVTDASGDYSLSGFSAGPNYYVLVRPGAASPAYQFSPQAAGGDRTADSDFNPEGLTPLFTIPPSQATDLDAGVIGATPGIGFAISSGAASGNDEGRGLTTDAAGNVYEIGSFFGTVDFDPGPGTYNLTSAGYEDVFVAKYTAAGALVWARRFGGANGDVGRGVAVAPDGSVYTTGGFGGTSDFDPGAGTYNLVTSPYYWEAFLTKLDPDGNFLWADQLGGSYDDIGNAIALGADGGVYVTGSFEGTADFDPGPGTRNLSAGPYFSSDIFVARYESSGVLSWAGGMGGTSGNDVGRGIAVAADGSVYTTGSFYQAADLDPGPETYSLAGSFDEVFVSKLDPAGNFVWAQRFGGGSSDIGYGIALGPQGGVHLTGKFTGSADFDPGPGSATLAAAGSTDVFVSALDADGAFLWADRMGGTGADVGLGITVAADGSLYTAVQFSGSVDFDPGASALNLTSVGDADVAVSQLDAAGNFISVRRAGGTGKDLPYAVALNADGRVFATGAFTASVDFDPAARDFAMTAAGGTDAFLWSLSPPDAPTDVDLSANTVAENQAPGTTVGALSSIDTDPDDRFTYRLVAGVGDADNALFSIDADGNLRTATIFDYEARNSYQVRVRSTDHAGLWTEATLTIGVVDIDESLSVGDRVWQDLNGNGVQDPGEPGLAGVIVQAMLSFDGVVGNGDDVVCSTAISDATGAYTLSGLSAGANYYLLARPPIAGVPYSFSPAAAGGDPGSDSDFSAGGATSMFTLSPGQLRTDLDAGLIGTAPGLGFAAGLGSSPGNDTGRGVATDAAGNIYEVGSFTGTVDFDRGLGTYNLTSAGYEDVFVAKYTSVGSLAWARRFGGTNGDIGRGIAVGADGSVYVTGDFVGTADFDPGSGVCNVTGAGGFDAFLVKLDPRGDFVWARGLGGTGSDTGQALAVAQDGSVVVTGGFEGTVDFDPGLAIFNLSASGARDVFVDKLNSAGDLVWARAMGGASTDTGAGVAIGPDGSVYSTGTFTAEGDFDPGPETHTLSGSAEEVYISRLDSAGNFVWAESFSGANATYGFAIAVDNDGNVYTTGAFGGLTDFDPGAGVYTLNPSGGWRYDAFLTRLDSFGSFVWARAFGGTGDDYAYSLSLGDDGNICTTGKFAGTADFDPGPGVFNLTSAGGWDVYASQFDAAGNFVAARRAGAGGNESGYGVATTADKRSVITGSFESTVDFDPGSFTFALASAGGSDAFLWSLAPPHRPAEIALTANTIEENQAPGTVVGSLSAVDSDPGEVLSWQLAAGPGDADNASFTVDANGNLRTGTIFDFEAKNSYQVRIRAVDHAGLWTEAALTIQIADLDESLRVGDRIWEDVDADGIQDPGEPGLPGAVVQVFRSLDDVAGNADDWLLSTDTSGDDGSYYLSGLTADANYYLVVRAPAIIAGYSFSPAAVGGDPAADSDVDAAGRTPIFRLGPGEHRTDLDVGIAATPRPFGFALTLGGTGTDAGRALATDAEGNLYQVGSFSGTVDFDPGPASWNLTSAGSSDIFVAKYTSAGALVWARRMGGIRDDFGYAIALAADGSVYTTGEFRDTADFDPGTANYPLVASWFRSDIFISKLDAAGNFVWAFGFGGELDDAGRGIAVAGDGSVYTTGRFQLNADFDPGPDSYILSSFSGAFLSKLDSQGHFVWARQFNGAEGNAVALDAVGNIYTCGSFGGTVDFDPGTGVQKRASIGGTDVFITKLDSAGSYLWAQAFGGTTNDSGVAIATAPDGSAYVTGTFFNTVDFDPGAASFSLSSAGSSDVFISKFDGTGNFLWARALGGSNSDFVSSLSTGSDGSVAIAGTFSGTADLDPGKNVWTAVSAGSSDAFITQLDAGGNLVAAFRAGGISPDWGYGVAIGSDGTLLLSGSFTGTVDFDPRTGVDDRRAAGSSDLFLWSILPGHAPSNLSLSENRVAENQPKGTVVGSFSPVDLDEGESFTYTLVDGQGDRDNALFTIDANGQLIARRTLDYEQQPSCQIRVRTTDVAGMSLEKALTIEVLDLDEPLSVGGRVWNDLNGNGIQDDGEPGLPGASVQAFLSFDEVVGNEDDSSVGMTTTDSLGRYTLAGLAPGENYYLVVRAPAGISEMVFSPRAAIGELDSDADPQGRTPIFTLLPGESRTDYDAGLQGTIPDFGFAIGLAGVSNNDAARAVTTDTAGNVYEAGFFQGTVDFDRGPGVFELTSAGYQDGYIAKYNTAGALLWARALGGSSSDSAQAIALAPDGGVLVAGNFYGTADFNRVDGPSVLKSQGMDDIYLAKFDPSGDFLWARQFGGPKSEQVSAMAVGGDGSVYLGGLYTGPSDFVRDGVSSTYRCAFVTRHNANGELLWSRGIGGTGDTAIQGIDVDAAGNAFAVGNYQGTVDFDPGPGTYSLTSAGGSDAFLFTLNSAGSFTWAGAWGSRSGDYANTVRLAADGSLYVAGSFSGTVDFDPGAGVYTLSSVSTSAFVGKFNASGALLWAEDLRGRGSVVANGLAVTGDGSIAIAGQFSGTADFAPGNDSFSMTSAGGSDAFVCLLDAAGRFVWARRAGGPGNETAYGVAMLADGEVRVAGTYQGLADFDPTPAQGELASTPGQDAYLTRIDASGDLQGAVTWGGIGEETVLAAATGPDGSVYTLGSFTGSVDFDPGPESNVLTAFGTSYFFSRHDSAGRLMWAQLFPTTPQGLAVGADGAAYVTGSFSWTVDFDPGPGTSELQAVRFSDAFTAKYDAAGNLVWARAFGGTDNESGAAVAVGADGSVYTTGSFSGSVDFDPDPSAAFNLTSGGFSDAFIVKLDSAGKLVWAKALGGASWDSGFAIAVDQSGSVTVAGTFKETADLDPGDETVAWTSAGSDDVFVVQLDGGGGLLWARAFGGPQADSVARVAVDLSGDLYIAGRFAGTADFDPTDATANLSSAGGDDVFLANFDSNGDFAWALRAGGLGNDSGTGLAIAPEGGVYLGGNFSGTLDFDPSVTDTTLTSAGGDDVFLARFNADGSLAWARGFGGPSKEGLVAIACDSDGNAVLGGIFTGTVDVDPGDSVHLVSGAGSTDGFLWGLVPPQPPTDLQLSANVLTENQPTGAVVGAFTGSDPDANEQFTFTLTSGPGDTDNAAFTTDPAGNLVITASFDYETQSSYSIRVRATDSAGLWLEKTFTITVTNVNEAPTDLTLTPSSVAENEPVGAVVGVLATADPDGDQTFHYSFATGEGDTDNGVFAIDAAGNLVTLASFDYEAKASYSIRVRAADTGGLWFEKALTVSVTNVVEPAPDMPGLYAPDTSMFYLRNEQSGGDAQHMFVYGVTGQGWIELVGDWNGDGQDTPGMYDPATSTFYLSNRLSGGDADYQFAYGVGGQGWQPLVGDWDGDGRDSIALYEPATSLFFFKNSLTGGDADEAVQFGVGNLGWKPIVGDWDGLPGDGFGFYEPATSLFFLKNAHTSGPADEAFQFGVGSLGWVPLAGNWDGTPGDGVGFYVPETGQFFLKNAHTPGAADVAFAYGVGGQGWRPLIGSWGNSVGDSVGRPSQAAMAAAAPVGWPSPAAIDELHATDATVPAASPTPDSPLPTPSLVAAATDQLDLAAIASQELGSSLASDDLGLLLGTVSSRVARKSNIAVK